ncbi:MHF2 (YDL160C-A) [Zygosaccharomyces parabailii]|uniref:ZYBA0S10-02938g1_1 n=1 Tax=Zygosaccharomyces bailii (strain CLIB 213 / ATCC 58445 / CBS 680 / BCRC 21525 / NBRC 1098 / NCYC 1416 / NRRL Y-2227) TaxID=1333698 RepID=A0A8J2TA69_ZYGB2|nr:MHF2 (YDL160C-A) [Zygosaccharomyces parabailii]CDF91244.1 ZYBA0S10-02938g1_1 [Zygosaccharomyces bailii CLIB 213]
MATVPKETIARILQLHSFEHVSTTITEETLAMLQKYLELFIREAVQRSVANKEVSGDEVQLTHEDLENITGMLLLDM